MSGPAPLGGPLMIFGSPRSGTTWIASLFDAHPMTLYLHEPDVIEKEPRLPFVPSGTLPADIDRVTQGYFERLAANRSLRSVHMPTIFQKAYRSGLADQVRTLIIRGMRLIDAAIPAVGRSRTLQVPDLADGGARPYLVLKSVDSIPRLPVFARALPGVRFLYIVRHPCGVVASKLRGIELGRMAPPAMYSDMLALPTAVAAGIDKARAANLSNLEKLAWEWRITNDWVYGAVKALGNVRTVVYDRIAADVAGEVPALLAWAGLDLDPQVRGYLDRLLGIEGTGERYFSLNQNPAKSANKWREELTADEQAAVARVVEGSAAAALFGF